MRRIEFEPGPTRHSAQSLHDVNMRLVLTAIAKNPGGTAADTSRATELSAATVSRMCTELQKRDLIIEGERVRGKRGQPGVALHMNDEGAYAIGCEIGFGQCYMFLRSLGGKVLAQEEFEIASCDTDHIVTRAAACFNTIMADQSDRVCARLIDCGFAIPTDFKWLCTQKLGVQTQNTIWDERVFAAKFHRVTGCLAKILAAGSAAAWAELAATPPPRPADFLYVFIDQFVQSGLLLDGRLWSAPRGRPGNIGRKLLKPDEVGVRLYDLIGQHSLEMHLAQTRLSAVEAEHEWILAAARGLSRATQGVTDGLELPLVIIDGNLENALMDQLIAQMAKSLSNVCWDNPPHLRRGIAGPHAPAKGAALRSIYTTFFSDLKKGCR